MYNTTKRLTRFMLAALLAVASPSWAADNTAKQTLFSTSTSSVYRIPSIARLNNGNILALCDLRYNNNGNDLGSGHRIDVVGKQSADNGVSWDSQTSDVLKGDDNSSGYDFAHGDPSSVVDRESGKIMVLAASGTKGVWTSGYPLVARGVSDNNGSTWTKTEVSSQFYKNSSYASSLFVSSGRMVQSTVIKKGDYYRVYAGVDTYQGSKVVYSDDFGATWQYLGGIEASPASAGDECKVEELPNGNVLLVCRVRNGCGRQINLFTYTDKESATGSWSTAVTAGSSNTSGQPYAASCDGEVLIVPAKRASDGTQTYVMLLSAAMSNNRENVGIYWKELTSYSSPSDFTSGWNAYKISTTTSCYTTMVLNKDGDVAFLFEEDLTSLGTGTAYNIKFQTFPLTTITSNAYSYSHNRSRSAYQPTSDPNWNDLAAAVTAPTLDLKAGTFTEEQNVTITVPTGTTVYYTTDGTAPSKNNGTKYESAITISKTTTLKAVAVDADGNQSDIVSAVYRITNGSELATTGVTVSLDKASVQMLMAGNSTGTYLGMLRHNVSPVQMLTSNSTDLNDYKLFKTCKNNMTFTNDLLTLATGSSTTNCYAQVVAPKGYRFTGYTMEFDTSNSTTTAPVVQYTYDASGNIVDGESTTVSNGTWSQTLDNGTNVLFFRLCNAASSKVVLKSFTVTYVIDQPFDATVPSASGSMAVSTGVVDPGTFSTNGSMVYFTNTAQTDLQTVSVVNESGTEQTATTTSDGTTYLTLANGDYYVEAPAKFRITGATIDLKRIGGTTTTVTIGSSVTSTPTAGTYIIGDGSGNYMKLNGTTIENTTNVSEATQWTVTITTSGSRQNKTTKCTLESNGYYIVLENNALNVSTSSSQGNWLWDSSKKCLKGSSSTSNPNYIVYSNGWTLSASASGLSKLMKFTTSTTTVEGSDYTAKVYNRDNSDAKETASLTSSESTASVTVSDYNNDAVHFNISGLTSGNALATVTLQLLPLNPEVQKLQVAAKQSIGLTGAQSFETNNYTVNGGSAVEMSVTKGTAYTIVARNAENAERTLWYTDGTLDNNSDNTGGYSNYYLAGSTAYGSDGALSTSATPYPDARVNTDKLSTTAVEATNIASIESGSTLQDNSISADDLKLTDVSGTAGEEQTVYVYVADMPTWNIMPTAATSKKTHIDYRRYTVKVKVEETEVVDETPVVSVTKVYAYTMKNAPHKTSSTLAYDKTADTNHTYVGLAVTSKTDDGSAAAGVLKTSAIISAIKTAMAETDYGFDADDQLRGILYVDMSGLTTVTADDAEAWTAFNDATADNCLYFVPATFECEGTANTIAKNADDENGFKALTDIRVYDQQPFYSPYTFSTGDHKALYTREGTTNGTGTVKATVKNMTAVLPFDITLNSDGTMTDGEGNTITFYDVAGYGELTGASTYDNSHGLTWAVKMDAVTDGKAAANQPYYVVSTGKGFDFSIENTTFSKTPTVADPVTDRSLTRTKDGSAWTAVGSYTGATIDIDKYKWYFAKELFWNSGQLTTYSNFIIRPFRAYLVTQDEEAANTVSTAKVVFNWSDISTGISDLTVAQQGDLTVTADHGTLTLTANVATAFAAYTTAGQLLASGMLAQGETRTLCVPTGVYMINNKKVVVK